MLANQLELLVDSERPLAHPERRAEVRHCVNLFCVVRRKHWRLTRAKIIESSADGMLLSFEQHIDEGAELDVSFKTAQPAIWFDAHAKVTRVVQGRRKLDPGPSVGLRFDALSAVAHLILRGHLRNFPRPPALREPPAALAAKSEDYAGVVRSILEGRAR